MLFRSLVLFPSHDIYELEEIRKRSKSPNNGPWVTDRLLMYKAKCVKRTCQLLPISIEIMKKINADETEKTKLSPDIVSDGENSIIFDKMTGEVLLEKEVNL